MDFLTLAQTRYTSKAYDATQKIPPETFQQFLEILRLSPSSINIQPWQFVIVQSNDAKHKVSQAMPDNFAYNIPKVINASHVVIFCSKLNIDEAHLKDVIEAEDQAGRFQDAKSKQARFDTLSAYLDLYKQKDIQSWLDNQIHIALGNALMGAQALGLNATPIGGFDLAILDDTLGLTPQGLRSVVILALGYHSEDDFNASLPKSRLSLEQTVQII